MRRHYLFAYDISDPQRQARVRRLLQGYALGVQKSLFECRLTTDELALLDRRLAELLNSGDTLHYLALGSQDGEWLFGTAQPLRYDVFMVV